MGKERENWWNFAGQLHTLLLLSINMYHSNWSTFLKAMLLQTSSLSDELLKKRQTQGPHPSIPKCPLIQSLSPVTKGNLWPGALQTVDFFSYLEILPFSSDIQIWISMQLIVSGIRGVRSTHSRRSRMRVLSRVSTRNESVVLHRVPSPLTTQLPWKTDHCVSMSFTHSVRPLILVKEKWLPSNKAGSYFKEKSVCCCYQLIPQ